jgi:hypothetical protein
MSKRAMMPNLNEEIEMQKVTFDVVSRPTKDVAGVTTVSNVTFDDKGAVAETVQIGTLTTARGTGVYNAVVNKDGSAVALDGTFTSRSQAGHAIQRAYFADERAAREAARADKAEQAAADKAAAAEARAAAKAEKAAAKAEADKAKAAEKAAKAEARAAAKAEKAAAKAEADKAKAAKAAATVVAEVIEKTAS